MIVSNVIQSYNSVLRGYAALAALEGVVQD